MEITKPLAYISALYVEDDDMTREELSKFLKRRLGKLFTAKNGEEGLGSFLKLKPDVLITDIKMSPQDGLSMAAEIRKKGYETPIIITSALSDSDVILDAVDVGIVKYVIKPVDTEELLNALYDVSKGILEKKGHFVSAQNLYDRESIKELERIMKTEISTFLKQKSGKGPRNVVVSFSGNSLKVILKGALTTLEKSLVQQNRNFEIVNFLRETLYKEYTQELQSLIEKVLTRKVELDKVEIDAEKDEDGLTFLMLQ